MPWSRQEAFVSQPLREWQINGQVVGKTMSANGVTYATITGAGHSAGPIVLGRDIVLRRRQVPFDKPEEALVLVQRWLAKERL